MLNKEQKQRLQNLHDYTWVDEDSEVKTAKNLSKLLQGIKTVEELWYASFIIAWDPAEGDLDFFFHHPLCDRGLALFLYWALDPCYFYHQLEKGNTLDEDQQKVFQLIKEVEHNLCSGKYEAEAIAFDPIEDFLKNKFRKGKNDLPGLSSVPGELKRPTNGEKYGLDYSIVFS